MQHSRERGRVCRGGERERKKKIGSQIERKKRGGGVTEGFICQPGDTSIFMAEYFSSCQREIRNHHKVGEHEYCP